MYLGFNHTHRMLFPFLKTHRLAVTVSSLLLIYSFSHSTFIPIFEDIFFPTTVIQSTHSSTTVMGHTAGEFNVNESGAATYSIPITVSPGTAGMEPNLSLNYSSQGGNGLVGISWSLGGLSVITRCKATLAQDSLIDGIDFDSNDKFCLDGERLVAINGTYGADGTEYRTEQNTFSRIISYGSAGNGPEKFKVWTKAGLILEFGYTADSRIEAQGKTEVLFWAANKIEDTKGNYISVEYIEENANGEYYPDKIEYTGNDGAGLMPYNSVQFGYESREDSTASYLHGSLIKTTKRLKQIEAKHGANTVRTYDLSYQTVKKISQLINVQECGADGSCFNPTLFEW